jgi:hypothetical protein
MWIEFRRAPNLIVAEMWKLAIEGEGLPTKIMPVGGDITSWPEDHEYLIMVPKGRAHVADEIVRKL